MKTRRPYPTLRHWREAQGLSQREAAKALGMSQSGYGKLEMRKRAPQTGARAKQLMEETGVPLEWLMGLS